jgi:hypothetical protein
MYSERAVMIQLGIETRDKNQEPRAKRQESRNKSQETRIKK